MTLWHWTDVHKVASPQGTCSGDFLQKSMLAVVGTVRVPGFHCTVCLTGEEKSVVKAYVQWRTLLINMALTNAAKHLALQYN